MKNLIISLTKQIPGSVEGALLRKISVISEYRVHIKYTLDNRTHVIDYDYTYLKENVSYTYTSHPPLYASSLKGRNDIGLSKMYAFIKTPNVDRKFSRAFVEPFNFPIYVWLADGETETPDTPTRHILVPPPSTVDEFKDHIKPRLTKVARDFAHNTNHSWVSLKTKSRNLHFTGGNTEAERRYDNTGNWMRLLIGRAWSEMELVGTEGGPTRSEVETLVEKVESQLVDVGKIQNFFHYHDEAAWTTAQKNRQILLSTDDYNPGELIIDINAKQGITSETPSGDPKHALAEGVFHQCATNDYDKAWSSQDTELITERTITIAQVRDTSADLATLVVSDTSNASIGLTPVFDAGTTAYTASVTSTAGAEIAIAATAVETGAVITGIPAGRDRWLSTGENTFNIVVTNGSATQTYTIVITYTP